MSTFYMLISDGYCSMHMINEEALSSKKFGLIQGSFKSEIDIWIKRSKVVHEQPKCLFNTCQIPGQSSRERL